MKTFPDQTKDSRLRAWLRLSVFILTAHSLSTPVYGQSSGLNVFINPLKSGLNLIVIFGFIAGCVMVIGGFLNARRDENWKMIVIYGIGVAGAVALMKALFAIFASTSSSLGNIDSF
jgi:hypothetical protein